MVDTMFKPPPKGTFEGKVWTTLKCNFGGRGWTASKSSFESGSKTQEKSAFWRGAWTTLRVPSKGDSTPLLPFKKEILGVVQPPIPQNEILGGSSNNLPPPPNNFPTHKKSSLGAKGWGWTLPPIVHNLSKITFKYFKRMFPSCLLVFNIINIKFLL